MSSPDASVSVSPSTFAVHGERSPLAADAAFPTSGDRNATVLLRLATPVVARHVRLYGSSSFRAGLLVPVAGPATATDGNYRHAQMHRARKLEY